MIALAIQMKQPAKRIDLRQHTRRSVAPAPDASNGSFPRLLSFRRSCIYAARQVQRPLTFVAFGTSDPQEVQLADERLHRARRGDALAIP